MIIHLTLPPCQLKLDLTYTEKLKLKGWVVSMSAWHSGWNNVGGKQRTSKKLENHGPTEGVKEKDIAPPNFAGQD